MASMTNHRREWNPPAAYRTFVEEAEPQRKNEAGRDLIRAIFGKAAIAEDSIPQPAVVLTESIRVSTRRARAKNWGQVKNWRKPSVHGRIIRKKP
jgi:predicted nucleic acid-binding protein